MLIACSNAFEEAAKTLNDPPKVQDEIVQNFRNEPIIIDVIANDSDPEGSPVNLESFSQPLHGVVSQKGSVLEYVPHANFSGNDSFIYSVGDNIGQLTDAKVDITISAWNRPTLLSNGSGIDLAVNDEGRAVAVWVDAATVYASQYLLGSGWQTTLPLYTAVGAGNISGQQVVINEFGQAMTVWKSIETDIMSNSVAKFGSGILSGALWTTVIQPWPQAPSDQPTAINVALNNNGSAALVWDQIAPNNLNSLWVKNYSSLNWDTPTDPILTLVSDAKLPKVAFNSASTVVAWTQSTPSSVWYQYKINADWGVPTQINSSANPASNVQVIMSPNEHGIIVWQEMDADSSLNHVVGRLFQLQANAVPLIDLPFNMDNNEGDASSIKLDADNAGNFALS